MNREQKAAAIEEVATAIQESEAIFAVDYRGISVPQAAELRTKLNDAGARFRIVKNTLTLLAVDKAGAEDLKGVLEGPTAFTFVNPEGDVALAAKALAQFRREHEILAFKGGTMGGEPLSIEQLQALSLLPGRDVLHQQLVGVVASPITGLVRGLNQLIAGFASQLQQLVDQGLVGGDEPVAEEAPAEEEPPAEEAAPGEEQAPEEEAPEPGEAPPAEEPAAEEPAAEAEQDAQAEEAQDEAEESAGEGEGGEPSTEAETEPETEETETDAPDEGSDDEKEN